MDTIVAGLCLFALSTHKHEDHRDQRHRLGKNKSRKRGRPEDVLDFGEVGFQRRIC